ncbi:MarR family transcriptional regulator [Kitasatospora sp. RG8]|uniref:MarR family winged helix-turn-helix transcriptional regulator n=1 Tax=Kitasatospora sp. RG8 TaxID=2820815 RepID=UPI0027DBA37B|nr:MarR family transcriptional regulator [Kitasatospora sp. RG8]
MPQDPAADDATRALALDGLARAAYSLSAADARLRGRATRSPGALSLTHARALRVLADEGPLPVGRLAAGTETTPAATTQLVNGLEEAGYVTRERPEHDRRSTLVTLTPAGRERHRLRTASLVESLERLTAGLDTAEVETVTAVLRGLAEVYDEL